MNSNEPDQNTGGFFSEKIGFEYVERTQDRVKATLLVREDLCNDGPGIMHGGALMAFADTLGAQATGLNLPPNAGTTTIESKTNFFVGIQSGETITAICTPLHRGRSTMVWQTRIETEGGKLAALVTQTQMVLMPE